MLCAELAAASPARSPTSTHPIVLPCLLTLPRRPRTCCYTAWRSPIGALARTMGRKIPSTGVSAAEEEAAAAAEAEAARLRNMNSLQWLSLQAEHALERGLDLCVSRHDDARGLPARAGCSCLGSRSRLPRTLCATQLAPRCAPRAGSAALRASWCVHAQACR